MAGLLKYFKLIHKKDNLDTDTLTGPHGSLSMDIPYSTIGSQIPACAKCNRKHQAKGDHKCHIFH